VVSQFWGGWRSDPEAFGEFYRCHAVAIERWIRGRTPDAATAAGLTAETFAQALVGLGRFRGRSDESARAWVYGIARNLVRRYHRRGRVELATCRKLGIQLDHDADELAAIESQIDAATQAPELTQALKTLPDTQPQALQLRVIDELDYDQAAALMGTSEHIQRSHPRVARPENPLCSTRSHTMTTTSLPPHLDHLGRQLTAAAHERLSRRIVPGARAFGS
jgi:RNA polymerase sigma factor (sigma-70 family)